MLPIVNDVVAVAKDAEGLKTIFGAGKDISNVAESTGKAGTRPSWRQSENDVGANNPDYQAQKSFKDGKEVPYGTKGSSRPDLYNSGSSIEVKNYNVTTESGINRLVNNVTQQVNKRAQDLPQGTQQTIMIDVRGQNVSNDTLRGIVQSITKNSDVPVQVKFMR